MPLTNNESEGLSKEPEGKQPAVIRIYTEVSPQRADEIRRGIYDASTPPRYHPNRWYAETVLDVYEPEALKERGLTRQQPIFASPIPYQGHNPIPNTELLSLAVDPSHAFVAEGDHLSEIIHGPNFTRVIKLKQMVGSAEGGMTRQEFEEKFNESSEQERTDLIAMSADLARQYWDSVIPYTEYALRQDKYYEPEILLLPNTTIAVVENTTS